MAKTTITAHSGATSAASPSLGRGLKGEAPPARLPGGIELDTSAPGPEHRSFPRARLRVPFRVWIGEGTDRRFSATLGSENLSVSGAFLESTFFLPVGTELMVRFELEPKGAPVEARAEVLRQERTDERSGRSGIGLRFLEFFKQTEVTLARLFLGEQLRRFAEGYLQTARTRSIESELDRVVDALAAWELLKVTAPADPWRIGEALPPPKR
jgi:PilZ domain